MLRFHKGCPCKSEATHGNWPPAVHTPWLTHIVRTSNFGLNFDLFYCCERHAKAYAAIEGWTVVPLRRAYFQPQAETPNVDRLQILFRMEDRKLSYVGTGSNGRLSSLKGTTP